jgi:hypothetical protein
LIAREREPDRVRAAMEQLHHVALAVDLGIEARWVLTAALPTLALVGSLGDSVSDALLLE